MSIDWESVEKILLHVYMRQWVRADHGVLATDCPDLNSVEIRESYRAGLLVAKKWYGLQTVHTTPAGTEVAVRKLKDRMTVAKGVVSASLGMLPRRARIYLVGELLTGHQAFHADRVRIIKPLTGHKYTPNCFWPSQPTYHFCLLNISIFREWREGLFRILSENDLAAPATSYVSTRGGEIRTIQWILTPEVDEWLRRMVGADDHPYAFPQELEELHGLYHHFIDPIEWTSSVTLVSKLPIVSQTTVDKTIVDLLSLELIEPTDQNSYKIRKPDKMKELLRRQFLQPLMTYLLNLKL